MGGLHKTPPCQNRQYLVLILEAYNYPNFKVVYNLTHSHVLNEESLIRIDCGYYGAFFEETGLQAGVTGQSWKTWLRTLLRAGDSVALKPWIQPVDLLQSTVLLTYKKFL